MLCVGLFVGFGVVSGVGCVVMSGGVMVSWVIVVVSEFDSVGCCIFESVVLFLFMVDVVFWVKE